jgi:sulfatase modifying factor 1
MTKPHKSDDARLSALSRRSLAVVCSICLLQGVPALCLGCAPPPSAPQPAKEPPRAKDPQVREREITIANRSPTEAWCVLGDGRVLRLKAGEQVAVPVKDAEASPMTLAIVSMNEAANELSLTACNTYWGKEFVWGQVLDGGSPFTTPESSKPVSEVIVTPSPLDADVAALVAKRLQSAAASDPGSPIMWDETLIGEKAGKWTVADAGVLCTRGVTRAYLTNPLGMKLRWIPPGELPAKPEEPRRVTFSSGFYIGVTEVTDAQFQRVLGTKSQDPAAKPDDPRSYMSWLDADKLMKAMSEKHGARYRLPTEAEWTYICFAGERRPFGRAGNPKTLGHYAQGRGQFTRPARVASYPPNDWGLYDVHGNVYEWCSDWFSQRLTYGVDPAGPATGSERVRKGGSFLLGPEWCDCFNRDSNAPDLEIENNGCRVVCQPPAAAKDVREKQP